MSSSQQERWRSRPLATGQPRLHLQMTFPPSVRPLDYFNGLACVPLVPHTALSSVDSALATNADPRTCTARVCTTASSPRCPELPASLALQDHLQENQGDARMQRAAGTPLQCQGASQGEEKMIDVTFREEHLHLSDKTPVFLPLQKATRVQ